MDRATQVEKEHAEMLRLCASADSRARRLPQESLGKLLYYRESIESFLEQALAFQRKVWRMWGEGESEDAAMPVLVAAEGSIQLVRTIYRQYAREIEAAEREASRKRPRSTTQRGLIAIVQPPGTDCGDPVRLGDTMLDAGIHHVMRGNEVVPYNILARAPQVIVANADVVDGASPAVLRADLRRLLPSIEADEAILLLTMPPLPDRPSIGTLGWRE